MRLLTPLLTVVTTGLLSLGCTARTNAGEAQMSIQPTSLENPCGYSSFTLNGSFWWADEALPGDWTGTIEGTLAWSGNHAAFAADDGSIISYVSSYDSISCTIG